MTVPNSFANVTTSIPLSQLDANFNTPITLGNTAIQLGNTVTTLNNMTLANVTISSGNVTITNVTVTTANVTTANIATAQIANVTVSGTGTFAAGSNTAPSITTSGDTNTGIFFPAADTIAFTEGGVESMRIDSSGQVGIGTNSPQARLHINSGAGSTQFRMGPNSTSSDRALINYNSTTNRFAIDMSGNDAVIVDGSGNLGLGVTPSAWSTTGNYNALQLRNASLYFRGSAAELYVGNNHYYNGTNWIYLQSLAAARYDMENGVHKWYNAPSGTAGNAITFTQAMTLDASGNLGIGTTSPASRLHIARAGSNYLVSENTTNAVTTYFGSEGGNGIVYTTTNHPLILGANNAERARITSGGNFGIGTTSPESALDVVGALDGLLRIRHKGATIPASTPYMGLYGNSDGATRLGYFGYGSNANEILYVVNERNDALVFSTNSTEKARITAAGGFTCAGIYSTTVGATNRDVFVDNGGVVGYVASIREAKTNIQDLTDTSWLHQLNPVTFNYRKKDEEGNYTDETDGDIQYGMIAEDVEQVRPDLCFYDEVDGEQELRGIQYSKLVPVMLKEIQKLKAEIDALKGKR